MNLLKKWWFWFIIILIIVDIIYYVIDNSNLPPHAIFTLIIPITIASSPIFFLMGLIINIRKNKVSNMRLTSDFKFWIWLCLFLISVTLIYYASFSLVYILHNDYP